MYILCRHCSVSRFKISSGSLSSMSIYLFVVSSSTDLQNTDAQVMYMYVPTVKVDEISSRYRSCYPVSLCPSTPMLSPVGRTVL
jgi:hypothetical protein